MSTIRPGWPGRTRCIERCAGYRGSRWRRGRRGSLLSLLALFAVAPSASADDIAVTITADE